MKSLLITSLRGWEFRHALLAFTLVIGQISFATDLTWVDPTTGIKWLYGGNLSFQDAKIKCNTTLGPGWSLPNLDKNHLPNQALQKMKRSSFDAITTSPLSEYFPWSPVGGDGVYRKTLWGMNKSLVVRVREAMQGGCEIETGSPIDCQMFARFPEPNWDKACQEAKERQRNSVAFKSCLPGGFAFNTINTHVDEVGGTYGLSAQSGKPTTNFIDLVYPFSSPEIVTLPTLCVSLK